DNLSAVLEAACDQGLPRERGDEGVRGNEDVRSRPEGPHRQPGPLGEKLADCFAFRLRQCGEPGQGRALFAVEAGRDSPDPALVAVLVQLLELSVEILLHPVRGIRHDRVKSTLRYSSKPL